MTMRVWYFQVGQRFKSTDTYPEVFDNLVSEAQLAEECGFHGIFAAEHHFSNYSTITNPLTYMAALSQVTSRVRLGTMGIVLPLHNPIRVAEEAAMVDQLSKGRLELGVARGYVRYEYEGYDLDLDTSGALMATDLEVLFGLWGGEPYAHTGAGINLPPRVLTPKLVQGTRPPTWYACGSLSSIDIALVNDMSVIKSVGVSGIQSAAEFAQIYFERCEALGIDPATRRLGAALHASVGHGPAHATDALAQARHHTKVATILRNNAMTFVDGVIDTSDPAFDPTQPDDVAHSGAMLGDEESAAKVSAAYAALGYTDLSLNCDLGNVTHAQRCETIRAVSRALDLAAS